jgi:hypothetical protein
MLWKGPTRRSPLTVLGLSGLDPLDPCGHLFTSAGSTGDALTSTTAPLVMTHSRHDYSMSERPMKRRRPHPQLGDDPAKGPARGE